MLLEGGAEDALDAAGAALAKRVEARVARAAVGDGLARAGAVGRAGGAGGRLVF